EGTAEGFRRRARPQGLRAVLAGVALEPPGLDMAAGNGRGLDHADVERGIGAAPPERMGEPGGAGADDQQIAVHPCDQTVREKRGPSGVAGPRRWASKLMQTLRTNSRPVAVTSMPSLSSTMRPSAAMS